MKLTTMDTVFYFNGNYYKQLDGVAMPWDPLLDQRCPMPFYVLMKKKWLRECPVKYTPILYKRYVDDIFVLLKSENHVNNNNNNNNNSNWICFIYLYLPYFFGARVQ